MAYDIVGSNLVRIKDALERRKYEEALQLILETLRFVKPLSYDWNRLVNLALRIVDSIEDTGKKCIAMLNLAEVLKDGSYPDYERLKMKVIQTLPYVYNKVLASEVKRRLEKLEQDEKKRVEALGISSKIFKIKEEVKFNPTGAATEAEWLYINFRDKLNEDERKELETLLKELPPKIEFMIRRLNNEPLLLPSKLTYEVTLSNTGFRGAEHIKAIIKLDSQKHKDEKVIDLGIDQPLRVRPGERKTANLSIPIDVPGKYKINISLEYSDALGNKYTSPMQRDDEITVVMLAVSQITDSTQLDELSSAKRELFTSIDNVADRLATLYSKFTNVKKVKKDDFIDDFHREYRDILFNVIEGEFLTKLRKTRDAYRKHLGGFKKAIEFYEGVVARLENIISKMKSWKDNVLHVEERLWGTTIKLREEAHQTIGDLVRDLVRIKWLEDRDGVERLLERLNQLTYLDLSDELLRKERGLLVLLLATKKSFDLAYVIDLFNTMKDAALLKSSGDKYTKELIGYLRDLKNTTS